MADQADRPPLVWFFKGAKDRRAAWQYWLIDSFQGMVYAALHYGLKCVSIDTCSAVGSALGHIARHYIYFDIGEFRRSGRDEAGARRNWAWLRPQDNYPSKVDAAMEFAYRQGCQTWLEFSILHRLWPEGRIEVEGAEHIASARAAGRSTLIAGLHLGNWEAIGPTLIGLGHKTTIVYQRPVNRYDHSMAVAARRRYGAILVPPGRAGTRAAYRGLADTSG